MFSLFWHWMWPEPVIRVVPIHCKPLYPVSCPFDMLYCHRILIWDKSIAKMQVPIPHKGVYRRHRKWFAKGVGTWQSLTANKNLSDPIQMLNCYRTISTYFCQHIRRKFWLESIHIVFYSLMPLFTCQDITLQLLTVIPSHQNICQRFSVLLQHLGGIW